MNNRGRASGLVLLVIIIVALIAAYLAVTRMGGFGFGRQGTRQEQSQQNMVDKTQDLVNQFNERTRMAGAEP